MKYNIVYDNVTISTDKELDEHTKRHLNLYYNKYKWSLPKLHDWLRSKGYEVEIGSST